MDNEGLLEWAEYEVASTWSVLKRAEKNRDELRKKVQEERREKINNIVELAQKLCEFMAIEIERKKRENVFEIVHGMFIAEEELNDY